MKKILLLALLFVLTCCSKDEFPEPETRNPDLAEMNAIDKCCGEPSTVNITETAGFLYISWSAKCTDLSHRHSYTVQSFGSIVQTNPGASQNMKLNYGVYEGTTVTVVVTDEHGHSNSATYSKQGGSGTVTKEPCKYALSTVSGTYRYDPNGETLSVSLTKGSGSSGHEGTDRVWVYNTTTDANPSHSIYDGYFSGYTQFAVGNTYSNPDATELLFAIKLVPPGECASSVKTLHYLIGYVRVLRHSAGSGDLVFSTVNKANPNGTEIW